MRETLPEALSPVALLEVDPDLAERVELEQRREAVAGSRVPSLALRPGAWRGAEGFGGGDVALYVISGFLARSVHAEQRSSVELLGPGHVLRPAVSGGEHAVFARAGWEVLETAWLAVLDLGFWQAIAAHPRVTVGLLDRLVWRSRALSMQLAIVRNPNLSGRLMGLLWHLALSYGRVGPRGMTLPLRLSHEFLAAMAGASRPRVSKTVKELVNDGRLDRDRAGGFVLKGEYEYSPAVRPAAPASVADGLGL